MCGAIQEAACRQGLNVRRSIKGFKKQVEQIQSWKLPNPPPKIAW
jgi:hypothetical protein